MSYAMRKNVIDAMLSDPNDFWFRIKMGIGCECDIDSCLFSNGPFWKEVTEVNRYGFVRVRGFCVKCRKTGLISMRKEDIPYREGLYESCWPAIRLYGCTHPKDIMISPLVFQQWIPLRVHTVDEMKDDYVVKCSKRNCGAIGFPAFERGEFR